jgi:hypothetical protein
MSCREPTRLPRPRPRRQRGGVAEWRRAATWRRGAVGKLALRCWAERNRPALHPCLGQLRERFVPPTESPPSGTSTDDPPKRRDYLRQRAAARLSGRQACPGVQMPTTSIGILLSARAGLRTAWRRRPVLGVGSLQEVKESRGALVSGRNARVAQPREIASVRPAALTERLEREGVPPSGSALAEPVSSALCPP